MSGQHDSNNYNFTSEPNVTSQYNRGERPLDFTPYKPYAEI